MGSEWWKFVPWHMQLGRARRRAFELMGSARYSRPALHELDAKLERHLPERGGFFVEAGAYNGYIQSNTYYFEGFKSWRGVLVEPIPELYRRCVIERPHSAVFNCALVPADYPEATVTMPYGDFGHSLVPGALGSPAAETAHVSVGAANTYEVVVLARTLSSLLDEVGAPKIDLLSLDVEGYEVEVLRGLDLDRHAPRYVLVEMLDETRTLLDEARTREGVEQALGDRYEFLEMLSPRDFLFRRRDV